MEDADDAGGCSRPRSPGGWLWAGQRGRGRGCEDGAATMPLPLLLGVAVESCTLEIRFPSRRIYCRSSRSMPKEVGLLLLGEGDAASCPLPPLCCPVPLALPAVPPLSPLAMPGSVLAAGPGRAALSAPGPGWPQLTGAAGTAGGTGHRPPQGPRGSRHRGAAGGPGRRRAPGLPQGQRRPRPRAAELLLVPTALRGR
ncbi:uncharacterized protein LOC121664630 [Corvus kubaryi]|uniref:uncharacterized protein LOC121664630 n=1 Tax=Corvus kubaryi TaxID=68294 RepID=UPI001C04FCFA|nr:uncharacterized protein LOC121664630 [Corvus kubaryi]